MVTLAEGQSMSINDSYGAVCVEGTITIDDTDTDIGNAAYAISNATTGVYDQH